MIADRVFEGRGQKVGIYHLTVSELHVVVVEAEVCLKVKSDEEEEELRGKASVL